MSFVISLVGSRAVGKTTLVNGLKKLKPDMIFREGFRRIENDLNMNEAEDFYENQRWYINREIKEFEQFKNQDKIALLVRGPEDIEFYTFHYARYNKKDWNIEENLKEELAQLRKCKSDVILYLDASIETIIKRKENDTKKRVTMEDWLTNWQPYIDPYFKSLPNTKVLNTENKTKEEILEWVINWIDEGCPL